MSKFVGWKMLGMLLVLGTATAGSFAQWATPADDVPAYHAAPPAKGATLPPILSGSQLTGPNFRYPWQVAVYKFAQRDGRVFYQLPCYCRCDLGMGHKSLRSCFEGLHGAECSTCAKEAVYAYRMTMQGKTVQQIRDGIMHKEFMTIDLDQVHS
jgi:hypothetical protein